MRGSMGRVTAKAFAREGASVVGRDVTVEPADSTPGMVRDAGGHMVFMQPCRRDDPADGQALIEGSEHGIRVHSISPGLIERDLAPAQLKDPEWANDMLGKTLLARLGRPDEVPNVACSWPQTSAHT
jgi:NAD(P)-dependent dehydrogenase (short-subunit alcohol dehydrogenase family)